MDEKPPCATLSLVPNLLLHYAVIAGILGAALAAGAAAGDLSAVTEAVSAL